MWKKQQKSNTGKTGTDYSSFPWLEIIILLTW